MIDLGLRFKAQSDIFSDRMPPEKIRDVLVSELPDAPSGLDAVLSMFAQTVLPLCKNEASPHFVGFGDTGDDPAALAGGLLALLTQQNLINQSFDAPSATFVEMVVLRWLRDLLGYHNAPVSNIQTVWDVGGVITHGGTTSNAVAMMLAREHKAPGTMHVGVVNPNQFGIIVPRGIGHYSVKSALTWIGVGDQAIEVDTHAFRYDLTALERALHEHRDQVMSVVAYAGDSRTQTVEHLRRVYEIVSTADPRIWLHVDACWGLVAAFSDKFRYLLDGITEFDSVTVDPHKVMAVPYSLSALVVRQPASLRTVSSYSDLIMQEDYAFGQVTPFIGTKGWLSLKLWMMMLSHGRAGLAALAEHRVSKARRFAALLDEHPHMLRMHDPDLSAVAFVYLPSNVRPESTVTELEIDWINTVNQGIHDRMLAEGSWYLHQFSLPDDHGRLRAGATLYPFRFMANNPRTGEHHMAEVIDYVTKLGGNLEGELR
ncbi:pyridoxal-dependent decarboxylase [Haloechinothrix sp. YIM 98757]|uniref:Pyridoxal-dependent decarboxylase n=1 Tax=Haloechinothrix aidingensis TaxID=2752311 RepID=A0A838A826_9PSEU|nr:pyridoxal-dependent decarboxylase [Haloechinothrix aidingensis]